MKATDLIFTLILAMAACCCKAQTKAKPIVLISETKQGNHIFLNYHDAYNDIKSPDFRAGTIPETLRDIELIVERPILLLFNAHFKQYPVYAAPGDTIYINTDGKNKDYYKFNQNKKSEYQTNFFNHLDSLGYDMGYPDSFERVLKPSNYINNVNLFADLYSKRTAILHEYGKTHHLTPDFSAFAQSLIKQYYVHSLLAPYWKKPDEYISYPQDYLAIINKSPLHELLKDDQWIYSSHMYRAMLASYVRYLSRNDLYTPKEFQACYRNAADSLNGMARDYALLYLMKSNINDGLHEYKQFHKNFNSICKTAFYRKYIDSLTLKTSGLVSIPKLLNTQLENKAGAKLSWKDIVAMNKGYVVYIDLWASWCGPCLAQIPALKEMESKLAGKAVRFLSISIDGDRDVWLKSLKKNALDGPHSQNYLLEIKSDLAVYLNAPPIPRYVLIDKKGVPSSLSAARPDDPNALKAILELVK